MGQDPRQRGQLLPILAVSALVSTILLVLVGSIVRVTGYGLGCPDWPLCYGQAIPPGYAGAWVEFSHRLLGAATSAQIALVGILSWRRYREERWIFRPAIIAVGLFVVQIVLGGLHVILEIPPETGLLHTGLAMVIVGLLSVLVAVSLPSAQRLRDAAGIFVRGHRFLRYLSITAIATYLLLLTGSYVTRSGASLACPAFPLCGTDEPALRALIDIQMLHRLTAFTVAFLVIGAIVWLLRGSGDRQLRRYSLGLGILILIQFGLGISNILLRLPMWSRVLHLTVAAIIWSAVVILWTLMARGRETVSAKAVEHPFDQLRTGLRRSAERQF
jgi:heme A synthase